MPDALKALARAHGVLLSYRDVDGVTQEAGRETLQSLLTALAVPAQTEAEAQVALAEITARQKAKRLKPWYGVTAEMPADLGLPKDADWSVRLESGAELEGRGPLPALPLGIHRLAVGGETSTLLSAPGALPEPARGWGLTVPLWGLRGEASPGLGDYGDLAGWAEAIGPFGPGFLGLNPVHAGFPTDPTAYSPYTPSHRRRWNILGIATQGGAAAGPLIDYGLEVPRKLAALRKAFEAAERPDAFHTWRDTQAASRERFATHQALSLRHGPTWDTWPAALQDPKADCSGAVDPADIEFFSWCQWRADQDLAAAHRAAKSAGLRHGLYLDLAVGTHPHGAETWEDRESFVPGVSLGAPPDAFSPGGQSWGLTPLSPHHLIATGFRALSETLRFQLQHAGMLRIDHILGFQRAFWVPETGAPGGYVDMPLDAMLAVARIEAARAKAVLVGEDLGNVPSGLRSDLKESGLLGCQVAMFDPPDKNATEGIDLRLLSFSSHDLPTWRGWRSGADINAREKIGSVTQDSGRALRAERQGDVAAFDRLTAARGRSERTETMHAYLADQPAALLAVQVENLLEMETQPNLPGTVDSYPNWRQRLPLAAAEIATSPAMRETAKIMAQAGRARPIGSDSDPGNRR